MTTWINERYRQHVYLQPSVKDSILYKREYSSRFMTHSCGDKNERENNWEEIVLECHAENTTLEFVWSG